MAEMIDLKCGNCGAPMRMHQPAMIRVDERAMAQLTMVPTWSPDERICRSCGFCTAPIFAPEVQIVWATFKPPEERRIYVPPGPVPLDLKLVGNKS